MNKLAHSNIDTFWNTILDRTKVLQLKIVNTKTSCWWSSQIDERDWSDQPSAMQQQTLPAAIPIRLPD
jgi:hypothetical protein